MSSHGLQSVDWSVDFFDSMYLEGVLRLWAQAVLYYPIKKFGNKALLCLNVSSSPEIKRFAAGFR